MQRQRAFVRTGGIQVVWARFSLGVLAFLLVILTMTAAAVAQQAGAKPVDTPNYVQFKKALRDYNDTMRNANNLKRMYLKLSNDDEKKEELGKQLGDLADHVTQLYPKLTELAEKAWLEQPREEEDILAFVVQVLEMRLMEDNYEQADRLLKGLLTGNIPRYLPMLYDVAGEVSFKLGRFEQAEAYFAKAEKEGTISKKGEALRKNIPYYRRAWAIEKTTRETEAMANDLPRVLLKTTKGDIELELYENQAPATVGNFIALVESGFYDGLSFHNVIPGLLAESGMSQSTADGGPGYRIIDEWDAKNARKHFRGTVSMMNSGKPNTAGSRFFIAFVPEKELDGKYTVFGRVLSGMDVVVKLERVNDYNPDPETEPDKIVKATVLRKRDHAYEPVKYSRKKQAEAAKAAAKAKEPKAGGAYGTTPAKP